MNVRKFDEELQLQNWFDECFYSNDMGLRKPDPEAYLRVSKALDVPPAQIAFFDDRLECVNETRAAGMHGYHCVGFGALQRWQDATSVAGLKPCATGIRVRLKPDTTDDLR